MAFRKAGMKASVLPTRPPGAIHSSKQSKTTTARWHNSSSVIQTAQTQPKRQSTEVDKGQAVATSVAGGRKAGVAVASERRRGVTSDAAYRARSSVFSEPIFSGDPDGNDCWCDTSVDCSTTMSASSSELADGGSAFESKSSCCSSRVVVEPTQEGVYGLARNGECRREREPVRRQQGSRGILTEVQSTAARNVGYWGTPSEKQSPRIGNPKNHLMGQVNEQKQPTKSRVHFSTTSHVARERDDKFRTLRRDLATGREILARSPEVLSGTKSKTNKKENRQRVPEDGEKGYPRVACTLSPPTPPALGTPPPQTEVFDAHFGSGVYVPHRNGMHTAWRRANSTNVVADRSSTAAAEDDHDALVPSHAGGCMLYKSLSNQQAEEPLFLRRSTISAKTVGDENMVPANASAAQERAWASDSACASESPSACDSACVPERRIYLRRDAAPLSARPSRENTLPNISSFKQGVDSSSYIISSGGPRQATGATVVRKPHLDQGTSRLATSRFPVAKPQYPTQGGGGGGGTMRNTATVTTTAVRGDRVFSQMVRRSRHDASPWRSDKPRPNFSRSLSPQTRILDRPSTIIDATAPLSSAAARRNLAEVARKSKVGTRADPVTLYRQRREAEVKRVSASARKKVLADEERGRTRLVWAGVR